MAKRASMIEAVGTPAPAAELLAPPRPTSPRKIDRVKPTYMLGAYFNEDWRRAVKQLLASDAYYGMTLRDVIAVGINDAFRKAGMPELPKD